MRAVAKLLDLEISVPGFFDLVASRAGKADPVYLIVDSTGLKIFGEGEWVYEKRNNKAHRKSWRRLHLGLAPTSGEIICAVLTGDDVDDPSALPELLDQIDAPVIRVLTDVANDGTPTSDLVKAGFGGAI